MFGKFNLVLINCGFALKDALSYVTHGAQEQIFVGIKQCNLTKLVEIFEILVLDILFFFVGFCDVIWLNWFKYLVEFYEVLLFWMGQWVPLRENAKKKGKQTNNF